MKNKKNIIIIVMIALAFLATFLIYQGCEKKDNVRFKEEYPSVSDSNVFTYRSLNEIINIMEKGTGVVYLGFPECPWCQAYVKYLDEVAKDVGIEKIYYYNILEDRKNNTEGYQKVVAILKDYLENDEEGNPRIYVPNVSFHIKGKVIGNDNETSFDIHDLTDPKDYWTNEEVKDLKTKLSDLMEQVFVELNACSECNE
mgnify:CR=1 FL=1